MFTETRSSIKSLEFGIFRKLATIVLVVAATLLSLTTDSANADVTVTWSDDGTDITATYSGIFDLSPYTLQSSPTFAHHEVRSNTNDTYFFSADGPLDFYNSSTFPAYGAGRFDHASLGAFQSSSGDDFTLLTGNSATSLYVSQGYISGNTINGSMTFSGATVSSIFGTGLDSPAVFLDDGTNQVIYSTSAAAVPEPATFALIGLASLGLGLTRRRRS